MKDEDLIPMALTAYGIPHTIGRLKTRGGETHPAPLGPHGLMEAASALGLAAVEMPLPAPEILPREALGEALRERGLRLVADFGMLTSVDASSYRAFLADAAALGSQVVRTTLSGVLCGDRRRLAGGWEAHLDAVARRLKEVLPAAEDLGVCIALENHQDATSGDLLRLARQCGGSPALGVCLDTGNPLAVGEGVLEFATRVAPLIRHIHLKDYTIHFAPEGYRLVRCPAGEGVVDFPRVLALVRGNGHAVFPGIEIAAQQTRTIPILEAGWWSCFPDGHPAYLPEALRVLWEKGRPVDEPYGSAWEQGADSAGVSAEEWEVLRRSAAYFRRLLAGAELS